MFPLPIPRSILFSRSLANRYFLIASCCSKSTSTVQQPTLPVFDEKDSSRIAMKFAIMRFRSNVWARFKAYCSNSYNLMKYRWFYERSFRKREFLRASRNSLAFIGMSLHKKKYDDLAGVVSPDVIKSLKKKIQDGEIYLYLLPVLPQGVVREKIFSADFSSRPDGGTMKPAFDITVLMIGRVDQSKVDRKKVLTILVPNRYGGKDETKGTVPADAYAHSVIWLTLTKPLEKDGTKDWTITRYEPVAAFVRKKDLDKY